MNFYLRLLALALLILLLAAVIRGCQCEAGGGVYVRSGTSYRCVIEP